MYLILQKLTIREVPLELISDVKFGMKFSYYWQNKKYRHEAKALSEKLRILYPNVELSGLDERGEKDTFEISVNVGEKAKDVNIWSGKTKGPPRKLKFPDLYPIVEGIKKLLPEEEE